MSKDYIQIPLGLEEFSVLDCIKNESEIVVMVIRSSSYAVCPQCGETTNKVHEYHPRRVEDLPIQGKRVWLVIKKRRFQCQSCGKVFTEDFDSLSLRNHRTKRYEKYLYEQGKKSSLKSVALNYHLSYSTFRRLWYRCAQKEIQDKPCGYPKVMGIDEFSVAKGHNYHTVITDIENHKVVATLKGRDKAALVNYLQAIPLEKFPEIFVVDIWKGYISAIKEICPNALIVADKFHIIRMANQALDFCRKIVQRRTKRGRKAAIWRVKHLLTKASERLTDKEKVRLWNLFSLVPILGDAYELKELLRDIYRTEDYESACNLLRWWCEEAIGSDLPGFRKVAKSFRRWFDLITNYFRYRITNGYTEGINNKIKLDKRMAYGYRNFTNQRLRILVQCA